MKIHVLMGQRIENYPGQYAPEALDCLDEYGHSDNPGYLNEMKSRADDTGEFERTEIVTLEVPLDAIMRVLRPAQQVIEAVVN